MLEILFIAHHTRRDKFDKFTYFIETENIEFTFCMTLNTKNIAFSPIILFKVFVTKPSAVLH